MLDSHLQSYDGRSKTEISSAFSCGPNEKSLARYSFSAPMSRNLTGTKRRRHLLDAQFHYENSGVCVLSVCVCVFVSCLGARARPGTGRHMPSSLA